MCQMLKQGIDAYDQETGCELLCHGYNNVHRIIISLIKIRFSNSLVFSGWHARLDA